MRARQIAIHIACQLWMAAVLLLAGQAYAQEAATPAEQPAPPPPATKTAAPWPPVDTAAPPPPSAVPAAQTEPTRYTVPAGTRVLLSIKSAVNTKSARPGDSVYLESTFPVVVDGHVLIPPGVYVQGVLDRVVRPGRVKGRAEVGMHFTSMIFPNGTAIEIPGVVNSLPGSANSSMKDSEGTIQQNGTKGKDAGTIAKAAGVGAGLGSIGGAAGGHPVAGTGYGALGGALAGGLYTLFTRGDEVAIPQGTVIEMVLQRPLQLEELTNFGPQNTNQQQQRIGPTAGQQQPLAKPAKQQMVCPPGDLGCGQ